MRSFQVSVSENKYRSESVLCYDSRKRQALEKLEHIGEFEVRENLANGVYGENRRELVEESLEQFQDDLVAEAIEAEVLESASDANELAREEDRSTTSESPAEIWYRRSPGMTVLIVFAGVIAGCLIYFFR